MSVLNLTQSPPKVNSQTRVTKPRNYRQLVQLWRHDPEAARSAEKLIASGFPDAAAHRVRQGMHNLLDQLIAARQAGQSEVLR